MALRIHSFYDIKTNDLSINSYKLKPEVFKKL